MSASVRTLVIERLNLLADPIIQNSEIQRALGQGPAVSRVACLGAASSVEMKQPCDEAVIRAGDSGAPRAEKSRSWILAATILGSSMAFIDGTVVNVALPALQTNLKATVIDVQWVIERSEERRVGKECRLGLLPFLLSC